MASRAAASEVPVNLGALFISRAKRVAEAGDRWWVRLGRGVASLGPGTPASVEPPSVLPARDPMGSSSGLDLLSASDANPVDEPSRMSAVTGNNAAGVQPMVRALGQVVSEHMTDDYRSLGSDRRFWALLGLINSLDEPQVSGAGVGDGGRTDGDGPDEIREES